MQIIVVGGGKVGYYLSKTLLEHGHRPHIIEKDRALCTRIADDLDVAVICGDGSTLDVLESAGAKDADALMNDLRGAVPSAQRIGYVSEYQGGARIKLAH